MIELAFGLSSSYRDTRLVVAIFNTAPPICVPHSRRLCPPLISTQTQRDALVVACSSTVLSLEAQCHAREQSVSSSNQDHLHSIS